MTGYLLSSTHTDPIHRKLATTLLEFDKVAATGRDTFFHLITFTHRVADLDVRLFSQRHGGKFIDTLNPLYDAYIKLVEVAYEAHAVCAKYLFLRRKMYREGPDSVTPVQIDEFLLAFSHHLHQMSRAVAEIEIQWKVTTDALRAILRSYCMPALLVSVLNWVDERNAARLAIPSLLEALPDTIQNSVNETNQLSAAYSTLEKALHNVDDSRRAGRLGSEFDFGIALFGLIHLDTAVLRYRACLVIANGWHASRGAWSGIGFLSTTRLRDDVWKAEDGHFMFNYCGMRVPPWLVVYRPDVCTKDGM